MGRWRKVKPQRIPKPVVETPRPLVGAAARKRLQRERARQGRVLLRIEADEVGLIGLLTAANLLSPLDHDRPKIEAAVQQLLGLMIAKGHA
jgi:hypothetical protein